MQKKILLRFRAAKMHCEFTYTTNAFQDESWDLSNFICYEGSRIRCKYTNFLSNVSYFKIYLK